MRRIDRRKYIKGSQVRQFFIKISILPMYNQKSRVGNVNYDISVITNLSGSLLYFLFNLKLIYMLPLV